MSSSSPPVVSKVRHVAGRPQQLSLPKTAGWGGARVGAGRKRRALRRMVPHRARPVHRGAHPVHVTLRSGFRPLRSQHVFPTVSFAIAALNARHPGDFRVVHFSVQFNHLHLIVEAADRRALSAGLRGLAVSIARHVNRLVMRRGRLWADRWHGHVLTTPRAVRHALVYVLANFSKHGADSPSPLDPYSSAPYFTDFREYPGVPPPAKRGASPRRSPVLRAESWLLVIGYRQRLGRISVHERPKGAIKPGPDESGARAVDHRVGG